mgnify:CR=1 FL=1
MRRSDTLIPTLREDPLEAEAPSHKLMLRAGLIRRLSGGLYTFLPLGVRSLLRVINIVRTEMNQAGAIEVLMPALQPKDIWERSGRFDVMGPTMFKVNDRQGRTLVLGPTHEEVITDLVSREINSYRQLPKTIFQIQTKFRDEIRPRFGLMRAKEFIMKDAYSFDADWDAAGQSYEAMYQAYTRIFDRCGLQPTVVEADTGAMGGSSSHEFMIMADTGEDGIVECAGCGYAANLERAERKAPAGITFDNSERTPEEISTPNLRTVEEVATFLESPPERLVKTLIYVADEKPIAVLIPGDRELSETRLTHALGVSTLEMADDETIRRVTNAPTGFAGPVGLEIDVYADAGLEGYRGAITGGNRADTHLVNVDLARDAAVTTYANIVVAQDGDTCPRCDDVLRAKRGIEVGHLFKLGTKYSETFNAGYLDDQGKEQMLVMGCYGIGVTRTLQAVVEFSHDDNGIIWPGSIAPYAAAMLVLDPDDEAVARVASEIEDALAANGIELLVDDRDERPGIKFKDADLGGFPVRIVVSKRSIGQQSVEIKLRTEDKPIMVPVEDASAHLLGLLQA